MNQVNEVVVFNPQDNVRFDLAGMEYHGEVVDTRAKLIDGVYWVAIWVNGVGNFTINPSALYHD